MQQIDVFYRDENKQICNVNISHFQEIFCPTHKTVALGKNFGGQNCQNFDLVPKILSAEDYVPRIFVRQGYLSDAVKSTLRLRGGKYLLRLAMLLTW